jgi:AcrR family transcriptional regulator
MISQRRSTGHRDSGARDRLLRATRQCVRDRGLSGASSRAITDAAGVNLAAITYYFGSKDDLVAAALADELRDWITPALAELTVTDDPAQRLLRAVATMTTTFDAERGRIPGLLDVFVSAARDPAARGPIATIWNEVKTQLAAVITELRARDAVPVWVEPDAMASLIVAVVAGTVVNEAVDPGGDAHRPVASQFTNLLISARM